MTTKPEIKIHTWLNDDRVNVKLYDTHTTRDIFWSEKFNSYVLVEVNRANAWLNMPECDDFYFQTKDGKWFTLVSVNGAGEVRWSVTKEQLERAEDMEERYPDKISGWDDGEYLVAARHFRLIPQ